MVKHIVFFRFLNFSGKEIFLEELSRRIQELKAKIKEIHYIEAGRNFSDREVAWDLALVSEFKTREDLETYKIHPDHMDLIAFLDGHEREVAVVDYEL